MNFKLCVNYEDVVVVRNVYVGRGFGKRMGEVRELLLEEGRECICTVVVGWMNYEDYYGIVECGTGLASGVAESGISFGKGS